MRIAIGADLHLEDRHLAERGGAWRMMYDWCAANDVHVIGLAGDTWHSPFICPHRRATVGQVVEEFTAPRAAKPIPIMAIPGQHDQGTGDETDSLSILRGQPGITVADAPGAHTQDICWLCLPWCSPAHMMIIDKYRRMSPEDAHAAYTQLIDSALAMLRKAADTARAAGVPSILMGHCVVSGTTTASGFSLKSNTFELTPQQLESVGADVIALGDCHRRQGYYVGALCQHNFGDDGNPSGFRVIDFDGGKVVADRFVELDTPRYFTVASEHYNPETTRPQDHVRIVGQTRPTFELAPNAVFQPTPAPVEIHSRTDEVLTGDTPIPALLAAWHKATECETPLESLQTGAAKLALDTQVEATSGALGCIRSINRIKLVNIGTHKGYKVVLSDYPGLTGLCGHNGAGKTFLVEAFFAAIFGEFPSRPGRLMDQITTGETSGMIAVELEREPGEIVNIRRELSRSKSGKTASQKAFITRSGKALAGPLSSDVDAKCRELFGDSALMLASVFSAQGQSGDLVDAAPRERKELLAKLLGTERLGRLRQDAKEAGQSVTGEAAMLRQRITDLELESAGIDTVRENLAECNYHIANDEKRIDSQADALAAIAQREAELNHADEARQALLAQITTLKADLADAETLGPKLNGQVTEYQGMLANRGALEAEAAKAPGLEKELQAIRTQADAYRTKRDEDTSEIGELKDKRDALREFVREAVAERQRKTTKKYQECANQLAAINKKQSARQGQTQLALAQAKTKLADLQKQAALMERIPGAPECAQCPLTESARQARDGIPGTEATLAEAQRESDLAKTYLAAEQMGYEDDLKALSNVTITAESVAPEMVAEGKALTATITKMEAERAAVPVAPDATPTETALQTVRKAEAELAGLSGVQASLDAVKSRLSQLTAALDSQRQKLAEFETRLSGMVDLSATRDTLTADKLRITSVVSGATKSKETHIEERGAFTAKLAALETLNVRKCEAESKLCDIAEAAAVYETLQQAFGRDGIPQLVVDSALPMFQDILADLLSEFDGRWAIHIQTVGATKTGDSREVLNILVDDGAGVRDISTYSGGEKKLLRAVLRIAFSALQAQRSGRRLEVFIFDEAFDALDEDNAARMLLVFERLEKWFRQIIIISHNSELLAGLPSVIRIEAA